MMRFEKNGYRWIQKLLWTVLAPLAFVVACKNKPIRHEHAASEPQYHIVPKVDSSTLYYYTVHSVSRSEYKVDEKKLESGSTMDLGMRFGMAKDSGDGMVALITYDKLHIQMDNQGEHTDVTARKGGSAANPVEGMLGRILGSVLTVKLDKRGILRQVYGGKEISDKILAALGGSDLAVKKLVEGQLDKLLGPEFAKNTLQQIFKLVPDSVVYPGDSWSITQHPEGMKMDFTQIFTLADVTDNMASVDGDASINSADDNHIVFMGQEFPAEIEGKEESHYKVALQTGMLMSGHSILSMKGKLEVMGKEVPIKIEAEKKVEGRRE